MNSHRGQDTESLVLHTVRLNSTGRSTGRRVGARRRLHAELASVAAVVLVLVIAGTMTATRPETVAPTLSPASVAPAAGTLESSSGGVVASCPVEAAWSDAYDAANGYVYVASAYGGVFVVKPPCNVVRSILPNALGFGTIYDPVTRDIVVSDSADVVAYVIHGDSVEKTVNLGFDLQHQHCPDFEAWDAAIESVLIADGCPSVGPPSGGGVDVLRLTTAGGATHVSVRLDAFDRNNGPTAVLVADGYVFSAGNTVDVFDAKSFRFVGDFAVNGPGNPVGGTNTLGWDPLTQTVILGRGDVTGHGSVVFLNVTSVPSGRFTFNYPSLPGILWGGVGGVAYSPSTRNIYLTAEGGYDVWEIGGGESLSHVYLGELSEPQGLTFDPDNQDMYVCGFGSSTLYVIR